MLKWPATKVYREQYRGTEPWPPQVHPADGPESNEKAKRIYTDEFYDALLSETEWTRMFPLPELTKLEIDAIIKGGECPVCQQGSNWVWQVGTLTSIIFATLHPHGCYQYVRTGLLWRGLVKGKFQDVRLATLEPDPYFSKLPVTTQKHYILKFQQRPDSSYLLAGDAGTGKTCFAHALLFDAIERSSRAAALNPQLGEPSCFSVKTRTLLEEIYRYQQDPKKAAPPSLTAAHIENLGKAGYRVLLNLDELDKIVPTQTRLDNLQELVDAVYLHGGQIVATSNLFLPKLEKKWQGVSSSDASILRRIIGERDANGCYLAFEKMPPPGKR
jgi:DNA replication protein DnaC